LFLQKETAPPLNGGALLSVLTISLLETESKLIINFV